MSKIKFQQTSLFAYQEVKPKIETRHEQVLSCFKKVFPCHLTNRQIAKLANLPINCITPRCLELRKKKMIEKARKDKDPETGRLSIFWKLKI